MNLKWLILGFLSAALSVHAERDGTQERDMFMRSFMFTLDAFADKTPDDQMSPLLIKAVVEGEKVNTEFLDFISPGLGRAWTEYYLASHRLRVEGRRKNDSGDVANGAVDQIRALELWKKWHAFWDPRQDAVFKKLKVE